MSLIKKYWWIFLIAFGIILWIVYPRNNPSPEEQTKIDSIFILTDSIDQRIDTVFQTIEKVHIEYEKNHNDILTNNTSEDYVFFLEYIRSNSTRLDSINNF